MRQRRAIAILTTLLLASAGFTQEEEPKKIITLPHDGPDFFCHILFAKGIAPVTRFEDVQTDPARTIVIVWGQWQSIPVAKFLLEQERPFRKAGGSLFVATDYRLDLADLGVGIRDNPVFAPTTECFGGHPQCPWLGYDNPGEDDSDSPHKHPLFNLLQNRIATNRPTSLIVQNSELKPFLPMPRKKGFMRPGMYHYLAVSPKDQPPRGRTLIMAGQGMLTNGMMLQPDTDNFEFAINAVEWLREAPNGAKRTRALFVVDGEIITNFDRNLSPPLPPIPIPTVEMVNRLLRGLEDESFFHYMIRQIMGDSYRNAVQLMMGIGTCLLLLYGAKKFLDGRTIRETGVPLMVGIPAGKPAETRAAQRQKALYRQNDASREARMLARQWLITEFKIAPEQLSSASAIAIEVSGFSFTRWWLQKHANLVVQFITATESSTVSGTQLARLIRALPRLSKAHRDGRLALLLDGKKVT
jgi:hypothetical protein